METKLEKLKQALSLQKKSGTWDYSPYMQGLTNGLIYALSILTETVPEYVGAPEVWVKDLESKGGKNEQ